MPVVLAIGTTHPLNIAGLGLDARVSVRLGVRLVTIVAGISAQSAGAVIARGAVAADLIAAQFTALRDVRIDAVHVGALLDAASVGVIARALRELGAVPVVCDPVIAASNGGRLADELTVAALRDELFARCALVTPNLAESEILLERPIGDIDAMEAAARDLLATGAAAVLVKGGHLPGDPADVLVDSAGVRKRFGATRLAAGLRGTGDLLACAIAARLAHRDSIVASVDAARAFVRECILGGVDFAGSRTLA